MSCVLSISGKNFDLDRFSRLSKLNPYETFQKGTPGTNNPHGKKHPMSGIKLIASNANFSNFKKQVNDTIKFLQNNKHELRKLKTNNWFKGECILDFGIKERNVAVQCDKLPAELLELAGDLGISIVISRYPGQ